MLLDDCLSRHARYRGAHPALIFGDQRVGYAALDDRVSRCARILDDLGLARGDRVAVLTANHPDFAVLLFGAARAGVVVVPLNYRLAPAELVDILADAEPALLIGQARYLEPLAAITPTMPRTLVLARTLRGFGSFDDLLGAAQPAEGRAGRRPDDAVLIQYTSGTTGKPKGVVSTHAGWLHASTIEPPLKGIGEDAIYLNVLPMCHTGGAKWVVEVLFTGATMVIADRFDAGEVAAAIARERVSNITLVPTMLYQLLDYPDLARHDLSSLRFVNHGGAPMLEGRLRQAIERLGCEFTQGYGMTEIAGGSITFAGPADHHVDGVVSSRLGSAGRPLVDCDVRLIDERGAPVATGEVGEVIVRTVRALAGYWRDPRSPLDAEGFYHTGDLARMDDEGYLTIVDRAKDLIVSGGLNIFSREVEDVLARHESIAEAYVVGVPDDHWGEAVKAVIVLHPGARLEPEDARDWCRLSLAGYKKPGIVDFANAAELPRTSLGKVVKRALRRDDWRTAPLD